MDKKELLDCINFFKDLNVSETDVTTEEERANHAKVVVVNYIYKGQSHITNKLYYKNILHQANVKKPLNIISYFGEDVYWLDTEKHKWPKGSAEAELERTIIDEMVNGDDNNFKSLLKRIINNNKTGVVQQITADGKSGQYHYNFENNNHWHDIILLIKAIITSKGEKVDKKYFSRLIFKWDGDKNTDRERSSLAKEVEGKSRAFIDALYEHIKSIQTTMVDLEIVNILRQKGQIILQGPPGTGKTFTAKDIAEQLLFSKVSEDKKQQRTSLEKTDQFKLIQFHPAYSYEDFVRGIVAEAKESFIEYNTKNKVFANFAKKALENYKDSRKDTQQLTEESWLHDNFVAFTDFIVDEIEKNNGRLLLEGTTTYIKQVEADCFRYTGDNWNNSVGNRMYFEDIQEMYRQHVRERQDIKKMSGVSGLAIQHASYFMKVLDLFYKFLDGRKKPDIKVNEIARKDYVLIIDEINRANLPAVLGELIYALEYRGETVESMYPIGDDTSLIIPPNLYIIGTMNTSDRSVGHIDYAIRRRFAFIDVLPKVIEAENFELDLFKKVSTLFIRNFESYAANNSVELEMSEHMSEEFRPEDVWLGHSYFIKNEGDFELRKRYEIIPILKEYVKDGILKQSAEQIIKSL